MNTSEPLCDQGRRPSPYTIYAGTQNFDDAFKSRAAQLNGSVENSRGKVQWSFVDFSRNFKKKEQKR